jgi:predicted DsbA family dithiol-disulfide isomerase
VTVNRVEVFADVMCPFAHVGLRRLREERRARKRETPVRVRAWPLEWINGEPISAELVGREVVALRDQVAPDLFVGFDPATFPHTSIPAFGLASAAYAIGLATGEAVSLALRDALFEQGRDVSDPTVLDTIARHFGVVPLDRAAAEVAVRVDWDMGRVRGVLGSPHFFVGDRDWFCPSLRIEHGDDDFDIEIARDSIGDFYAAALG